MGNYDSSDGYCVRAWLCVSNKVCWKKKHTHTGLLSLAYMKAYKLVHPAAQKHQPMKRTEDAGRTNCCPLVKLTSCPTMSLIKAKQTRSERSVSD